MARLKITTDRNFLRQKSKPVTEFDARLHTLLDDMLDTLEYANGIGLAAPQVGVLLRVALVMTDEGVLEIINPEITSQKNLRRGEEACLSISGEQGYVVRPHKVSVRAFDRFGKEFIYHFRGMDAVCVCHEIDHLDGILYIDKVEVIR